MHCLEAVRSGTVLCVVLLIHLRVWIALKPFFLNTEIDKATRGMQDHFANGSPPPL